MDPNLMNNPEMMKSMMEMMQNPEIMKNVMGMMQNPEIQKMMQDPNTLNNLSNLMKPDLAETQNEESDDKFTTGDHIMLTGLTNENYNNKDGIIKGFDKVKNRYLVYVDELEKTISVKEDNCLQTIQSDSSTEEDTEEDNEEDNNNEDSK